MTPWEHLRQLRDRLRPPHSELDAEAERHVGGLLYLGEALVFADWWGRLVHLSPWAEILLGWTTEQVRGQRIGVLMPLRYREAHRQGIARARWRPPRESKVLFRTNRFEALRRDGSEIEVDVSVGVWRTPGGRRYFVAGLTPVRHDATEATDATDAADATDATD